MDLDERIEKLKIALKKSEKFEKYRSDPGSSGGYDDQHDGQGAVSPVMPRACTKDWEIMGH